MNSFFLLNNPGFNLFGVNIAWYGVIMAFSMLIAALISAINAKQRGVKPDEIVTLALIVLPLSIIGARLYYVAFYGQYSFVEILQIWKGGMAIYGGVIGGAVGIAIYCLIKKRNFLDYSDIIAPTLILAQAIGRWGNFINQEAYGYVVTSPKFQWFPFSVFIDATNSWHLATFFYESMWNLIGFAILMIILYKVKNRGVVTASYFIFYGIGRFLIEGLREDSLFLWGTGIRVSQALSIILVIAGIVWISIIIFRHFKLKKAKLQIESGDKRSIK